MSDDPNLYFFRDAYDEDEMISRVSTAHYRDDARMEEILEEIGLEEEYVLDNPKETFLSKIESRLDSETYTEFLEYMFDEYGEKGDRVNLQFYRSEGLSYDELVSYLESDQPQEVAADGGHTDYSSYVTNYRTYDGSIVDIQFRFRDNPDRTTIEDEGYAEDKEGDHTDLDNLEISEYAQLVTTGEKTVEAPAYTERGLVAVSNSDISNELRKNVQKAVSQWADASSTNIGFHLQGTELLLIQNLMEGDNSGLDYSGFLDRNLNTAKYRGDRDETLSRSPVLNPAQNQGNLTQARFYYSYDDGTGPRPVQTRIYDDAHISTSKPTKPDFIDVLVGHFYTLFEHRNYLVPFDNLVDEFADVLDESIYDREYSYHRSKKQALGSVVEQYIDSDAFDRSEGDVFEAAIANIGIKLSQLDFSKDEYPDVPSVSTRPEKENDLKEFFEDYAGSDVDMTPPDFDELWKHLEHILSSQAHNSPISPIETAKKQYAL